jgi:hypothetical protein
MIEDKRDRMKHREARPGRPGQLGGRRKRWRGIVREMRKVNPGAVKALNEAQLAMAKRHLRGRALRGWLVAAAAVAAIVLRCAL